MRYYVFLYCSNNNSAGSEWRCQFYDLSRLVNRWKWSFLDDFFLILKPNLTIIMEIDYYSYCCIFDNQINWSDAKILTKVVVILKLFKEGRWRWSEMAYCFFSSKKWLTSPYIVSKTGTSCLLSSSINKCYNYELQRSI